MGRKSNADQRRSEIVEALFNCLAEQGHEKITIKAIAAEAGLPYGVIHYYFKSKDDIISELASTLVERYGGKLGDSLAQAESDAERIDIAVDFVVEELVFNRPLNRVFFNLIQMAFEREPLHQVMTAMFREYRRRIVDVLEAAGLGDRSRPVGAAIVAMSDGFALQWMIEPGVFTKEEVRRILMQVIGKRLGAPAG